MKKIIIFIVFVLVAVTSVQLWMTQERTGQKTQIEKVAEPQEAPIGGSFTLTDQYGKTRHDTDFRGRVMLVSFGFTHCPDICPVTVSTLSKTMELLAENAEKVAPVFISVDPERDTPGVMKDFLSNFDKRITGLTGTEIEVKQVADAYKVYYAKSANDAATEPASKDKTNASQPDYSVDHSGYIYMMGKEGQFLRVFPYNVPEQELAHAVEDALR